MSKSNTGFWTVGAGLFGIIGFICLMFILAPLLGAISGWLFSIVFTSAFNALNNLLGTSLSGAQMGAMLAFAGSFFRSITQKSD